MWTWTNAGLGDYLKSRYDSNHLVRVAIIPFEVPETFAPAGNESLHFGRELARKFQAELARTGQLPIVELFNLDSWPGKREEYFSGNYKAMQYARDAGYDLVAVGYMEDLTNADEMQVLTKIIDVNNFVTIWSAKTTVSTGSQGLRAALTRTRLFQDRPDLFSFPEKTEQFAACTVTHIMDDEAVP